MAASIETQRLISVSLGKIAQSRGQRGGINLHKNLLVATVLHKARTAYMIENYNYQQNLQRQKIEQQQQPQVVPVSACAVQQSEVSEDTPVCHTSQDQELNQPEATPSVNVEIGSVHDTPVASDAVVEPMSLQAAEEAAQDKENSPPCLDVEDRMGSDSESNDLSTKEIHPSESQEDHLLAATRLSQDAQLAASSDSSSCGKQSRTSASTTCVGASVLKRRRDNPSSLSPVEDCSVSKKARVSCVDFSPLSPYTCDSSDESDGESDSEVMHTSDSPQISNLVSIFNSGFSGLCASSAPATSDSSEKDSGYQSELELSEIQGDCSVSSSPVSIRFSRQESPCPTFKRKLSDPSLLCSSQVGRLGSLPSAIILSA